MPDVPARVEADAGRFWAGVPLARDGVLGENGRAFRACFPLRRPWCWPGGCPFCKSASERKARVVAGVARKKIGHLA